MVLDIIAEYVISNLIDKYRDELPDRMVNLMTADDSLDALLKKKILPNSLDALKSDHPELQQGDNLTEKVIAPAIARMIYQSTFSGDLSDAAAVQSDFEKLLAHDLSRSQQHRLRSLLDDFSEHFRHELAKHQDAGDALIMQALSRIRSEMRARFEALVDASSVKPDESTFKAEHSAPIFISYARDGGGREFAAELRQDLDSYGFKLWQDVIAMEGGKNWLQQIYETIKESAVMVLVLNDAALVSENVRDEWHYARQVGTPILPVTRNRTIFDDAPRWLGKNHVFILDPDHEDYTLQYHSFLDQLNNPPQVPLVPFNAPSPGHFVDRPDVFEPLLAQLLDGDRQNPVAITTALKGGGGFGKTTLAMALCHDRRVRDAYDDGVLWVEFGEQPDVLRLLNAQIRRLGGNGIETEINDARTKLCDLLEGKDVLLVLDDVWNAAHAQPFLQRTEKKRAAFLVTTRLHDVVILTDSRSAVEVDEMTSEQALTLLSAELVDADKYKNDIRILAERLGKWALMLELVNKVLRKQISRYGDLKEAIQNINQDLDNEGFTAFDLRNAEDRNQSITISLNLSLNLLEPDERRHFIELAIFQEDTDVPVTTLAALWGIGERPASRLCETLADISLIKFNGQAKTIRMLGVIRKVVAVQLDDPAKVHARLIENYGDLTMLPDDYAWRNVAYHLIKADKRAEFRHLLFDYNFLQAKFDATDIQLLLNDFKQFYPNESDKSIQLLSNALELSAHILVQDKNALAHQLLGRLMGYPEISHFDDLSRIIEQIVNISTGILPRRIDTLHETHLTAGGMLLKRLPIETSQSDEDVEILGLLVENGHQQVGIITWSKNKNIQLWDSDGNLINEFPAHPEQINGVVMLPDKRLLTWSQDKSLRIRDLDGKLLHSLIGHTDAVSGVSVSDSGSILSWSDDNTLRVWNSQGECIAKIDDIEDGISGAMFLKDDFIVTWSDVSYSSMSFDETYDAIDNNAIRVWDPKGVPVYRLVGHSDAVLGAIRLDDGRLLSWSEDNQLMIWTITETSRDNQKTIINSKNSFTKGGFEDFQERRSRDPDHHLVRHRHSVRGVLQLDNERILSWSEDATLVLWDVEGNHLRTLSEHTTPVVGVLLMSDGRILSWSEDHVICIWDNEGILQHADLNPDKNPINGAVNLSSGKFVTFGSGENFFLWNLNLSYSSLEGHNKPINGVEPLDNTRLVSWSTDTLRMWNSSRKPIPVNRPHKDSVTDIVPINDKDRFVSWANDRQFLLWNIHQDDPVPLKGHTDVVKGVVRSSQEKFLSWSDDGILCYWSNDGVLLSQVGNYDRWGSIWGVAELSNGKILYRTDQGRVGTWDLSTSELYPWDGHKDGITHAEKIANDRILTLSKDRTMCVWEIDGNLVAKLSGHDDEVRGAMEVNTSNILSWAGENDTELRLWNMHGELLVSLQGHEHQIRGAISLSNERIFSWADSSDEESHGSSIIIWKLPECRQVSRETYNKKIIGVHELNDGRIVVWSDDDISILDGDLKLISCEQINANRQRLYKWSSSKGVELGALGRKIFRADVFLDKFSINYSGEKVTVYHSDSGQNLSNFHGDARFSACAAFDLDTIVVGDEMGRVNVLRYSSTER